jgi:hypothetical protein
LVEQAIGITILLLMFGAVGLASIHSQRAFQAANTQDGLQIRARRSLDRIADEVEMAGASGLVPLPTLPFGSSTISFATPTGIIGGVVQWGDTTRIQFQYSATDPKDGVDNDGNGMIDDGQVVLTRHLGLANQQSVVLVHGVTEYMDGENANAADDNANGLIDEKGLSFDIQGKTLTIRLTLGNKDARGTLNERTVETSVRLRN